MLNTTLTTFFQALCPILLNDWLFDSDFVFVLFSSASHPAGVSKGVPQKIDANSEQLKI